MTLRSRVPVLISELLECGIAIDISPDRFGGEMTVSWRSMNANLIEEDEHLFGHVHVPFEKGVHGANCIELEKVLVEILQYVMNRHPSSGEPK